MRFEDRVASPIRRALNRRSAPQRAPTSVALMAARFVEQDAFAAVRVEMADRLSAQHKDLLRWLFVFRAGTIIRSPVSWWR
jgi:hypothetical protein